MELNNIYNIDCIDGLKQMVDSGIKVTNVLTSPPYNIKRILKDGDVDKCYDIYQDNKTNKEYCDWTVDIFNLYDKVLEKNGCVLYNMSYGGENTECMNLTVADIITRTNFTIADIIVWEKKSAVPNNVSLNRLTRICEFIYVFCRKSELMTFETNKKALKKSKSGQTMYETIYNKIVAKNNDESNALNKATFSTELCFKLMNIYCKPNSVVLDNFIGTGTTAVACIKKGFKYIGFELSVAQCEYAQDRINKLKSQITMFD